MALTDYLTQVASDRFLDTDPLWRQFVIDHKAVIIANAVRHQISPGLMVQCNYNMPRYLRLQKLQPSMSWIVFLINDLKSDIDFNTDLLSLLLIVPQEVYLTTLYQSYQTTSRTST